MVIASLSKKHVSDPTITPSQKKQRFSLTNVSWLLLISNSRHGGKDAMKKHPLKRFQVCRGRTIEHNDVGAAKKGHRSSGYT